MPVSAAVLPVIAGDDSVRSAGENLSRFFPRAAGDVNELPDDIDVES